LGRAVRRRVVGHGCRRRPVVEAAADALEVGEGAQGGDAGEAFDLDEKWNVGV
jgi:hypothetical protein